jgi:hypothetical protein
VDCGLSVFPKTRQELCQLRPLTVKERSSEPLDDKTSNQSTRIA